MKKPFTILLILLALGICFFYKIDVSYTVLLFLIVILIIMLIFAIIINKKVDFISNLILFILIFTMGGFIVQYKMDSSCLLKYKDKYIEVKGRVLDTIKLNEGYGKYLFEVEHINYEDEYLTINEKVLLEVYGGKTLEVGDLVNSKGTVLQPKRNTNPGLFNYRLYLNTRDIFVKIKVKDYFMTILPRKELSLYRRLSLAFTDRVTNTFNQTLSKKNAGIISSIILGDDIYMGSDIIGNFRELGLAHVLAVSGLHIGILAYFFIALFKHTGLSSSMGKILTVLIIWFYGLLIGYPVSVVRANIMFTLLILATLIHKRYDSLNILCFAGFIMLLYNPLWLFDVGFQLSFSATCSIILFGYKVKKGSNIKVKVLNKLFPIIGVQLGTLPVISYHFNKISIVALIANILLIPLISISVILGFISVFSSYIWINISALLGFILNMLLNIVNTIVGTILSFPITSITLSSPKLIEAILYYIMLLILYKYIKLNWLSWNIKKLVFEYLLIYIVFTLLFNNINHEVSFEFIDIGQGDCTLMKINQKAYLIDTGGSAFGDFDVGEKVVVPYLNKTGVKKLEGVFISHFHADHCKGLLSIMDNMKIKKIIIGPRDVKNPLYVKIISKAEMLNIPIIIVSKGDKIYLNGDFYVEVLSPSEEIIPVFSKDENNLSLVFLIKAFDKKILFTGDIEKEIEEILLKESTCSNVDILKVPHHGSSTSSTIPFIEMYNPKYAVIQVGDNNFGHPDKQVINRYVDNGTSIFRNDNNGLITFRFDSRKLNVSCYLDERINIGNIIVEHTEEILFIILYALGSIYLSKLYESRYNRDYIT